MLEEEEQADGDGDGDGDGGAAKKLLWDRKLHGGFPEVKGLKRAVRDLVQPGRGLGHVDGHKRGEGEGVGVGAGDGEGEGKGGECVECK